MTIQYKSNLVETSQDDSSIFLDKWTIQFDSQFQISKETEQEILELITPESDDFHLIGGFDSFLASCFN